MDRIEFRNKQGLIHRIHGPSIVSLNRVTAWSKNGRHHREDGPALCGDGHKYWHYEGKYHRKNGPAIVYSDGSEQYWVNGIKHTEKEFLNLT